MQEKDKSTGKANKTQKKSWFQGLKSEFNKIVWTDKATLAKQTVVCLSSHDYSGCDDQHYGFSYSGRY